MTKIGHLRKSLASIAIVMIASCAADDSPTSPSASVDAYQVVVVEVRKFGTECSLIAEDSNRFVANYFRFASIATGEAWNQFEVFGCGLEGNVRIEGSEAEFRIDLSGGAITADPRTRDIRSQRYFVCDENCRKKVGWDGQQIDP